MAGLVAPDKNGPAMAEGPCQFLSLSGFDNDGVGVVVVPHLASFDGLPALDPSLVIDAIVGYGLSGPPRGRVGEMIQWASETPARILSLDVPSGVDSTTGETPGVHVSADRTLTLALPKTGLVGAQVGELWLADIGITAEVYRRVGIVVSPETFEAGFLVKLLS